MQAGVERHEFASDNTAALCPEAWAALQEANAGAASSYGDDQWTERACRKVRELFEADCDVYLVFNGTAANALALAQLCQSFHSIICYERAHIHTDECGAPEFLTKGSKLVPISGSNGKLDLEQLQATLRHVGDVHSHRPRAISITEATECGTVYNKDQIAELADLAHSREMFLHMDGARFANAIASLGCDPKTITWEVGVDVLCFGGTKNGLAAGELIIFFRKELARDFDYRIKQAGQLASKMRFLAAPWLGLLNDNVWLKNARHANNTARQLAGQLQAEAKIDVVFPVEANAVFLRIQDQLARDLRERGWQFYKFIEPDIYRVMCAWSATEEQIKEFVSDIKMLRSR